MSEEQAKNNIKSIMKHYLDFEIIWADEYGIDDNYIIDALAFLHPNHSYKNDAGFYILFYKYCDCKYDIKNNEIYKSMYNHYKCNYEEACKYLKLYSNLTDEKIKEILSPYQEILENYKKEDI